tara:strand:+ start:161 stop:331 length:171 start_codon:yes stop_codon:yes gene_type:complete
MSDISEDHLIAYVNEVIALWVGEEVAANDATVSPAQRLEEHRDTFLAELKTSWNRQ